MLRELKVLKKLKHEHIVQLKESFRRKGKLYLVFEYVDRNLLEILEQYPNGLDQQLVKRFIYQLCKSIIYIHSNEMIHRDIKPENILITNDLFVKVCDFGFTRSLPQKGGILTDYVATRWYRAPELLLGCSNYGREVDFWAVGCIMGEISDGKAMFPSENELEQLFMIQKLLGTLPQNMLELFSSNPRFSGYKLDQVIKPETLERKYYGKLSKNAFTFMKGLLKLDPRERLIGNELIMHPYFDDMRSEDPEFSNIKSNINIQNNQKEKVNNINNNVVPINSKNTNTISQNKPIVSKDELITNNNNMNSTQRGKFITTKTNFGLNQNFQENFSNIPNNQQNYSKSPPKEIYHINNITNNINNGNNPIINKFPQQQQQQQLQQQQNKISKKNTNNFDNNSTTFNFMINANKTGYQTFFNIVNNKDDIYNFDIDTNFEDKINEKNKVERKNNINNNNNINSNINSQNKKNPNVAGINNINPNMNNYNLIVIEEENLMNNNNLPEDFDKKLNFANKNNTKNFIPPNQMNETRFNKFKPDAGGDFYEEENIIPSNKVYSPKNSKKSEINQKFNKNFIKEESPENRFPPTGNNMINTNNLNFLPHITFHRNYENDFKKTKNIFH